MENLNLSIKAMRYKFGMQIAIKLQNPEVNTK